MLWIGSMGRVRWPHKQQSLDLTDVDDAGILQGPPCAPHARHAALNPPSLDHAPPAAPPTQASAESMRDTTRPTEESAVSSAWLANIH